MFWGARCKPTAGELQITSLSVVRESGELAATCMQPQHLGLGGVS
eukprot:CAMPEP_0177470996 /NCGR_PEP_ID=MMETSP0369-20130122/20517_1 /TAXON_ID=447022 ORGANISM="Scrippsiella hangoei-like, Strain SHHI-4" /NCGR_SAMPLE_ID=MMETSP0369 /ASSEMBLY_ACC=CAM_ASM_000364 /LENGTH=44 /DNA_ID= /DNA_START= /DNA_END= /DNA_ORIENTATION=